MSLSTLLEAAKYLDYLDSNNQQQQQQQQQQNQQSQLQFQSQATDSGGRKSNRRQRSSKKNAANTMVAMSLPTSRGTIQMQGVPIPVAPGSGDSHHAASLSSSFTTGSPLSSFASTALFCSKASGVTSASSSAASSLSSSDSSSSCGEILMGDNDFNHQSMVASTSKLNNNTNNNHHNYHLTHQLDNKLRNLHQYHVSMPPSSGSSSGCSSGSAGSNSHQSIARYIAATSAGPQLVTMTTSSSVAIGSSSAPIDGSLRAGHVIHAATTGAHMSGSPGSSFDQNRHYSMSAGASGIHGSGQGFNMAAAAAAAAANNQFGSETHLSSSPGSCPPLIMARVQPMILNSLSPSAQQSILAFQPATASSPTSSSSSYSRHRELHKTLEKNRRAHLRHCFELLKAELPASECVDKKTSHINIIKSAIRYVLALRQQECEIDNELQRLTKIKTELTENLSKLHTPSLQQQPPTSASSSTDLQPKQETQQLQQQPAAEQQLSLLLSQSKID